MPFYLCRYRKGTDAILCLCEEKMWLMDNLLALPIDYLLLICLQICG